MKLRVTDYRLRYGQEQPRSRWAVVHGHTTASDGFDSPADAVERAWRAGVDTLILTDHNEIAGYHEASHFARDHRLPLDVLPGVEVSSRDGHIGALGVSAVPPRGRCAEETNFLIHRYGGVAVAFHAGDPLTHSVSLETVEAVNRHPDPRVHFDFVEVVNGGTEKVRRLTARAFGRRLSARLVGPDIVGAAADFLARLGDELGLRALGGADFHYGADLADVVMGFPYGSRFLEAAVAGRTGIYVRERLARPSLGAFLRQRQL